MWRKLLRVVHPDSSAGAGGGELFVWCRNLQEYVAGDHIVDPEARARRDPPNHPKTGERIDYAAAFQRADSFETLTRAAVMYAEEVGEPYCSVLRLLSDCRAATPQEASPYRAQHIGASYKQLALIAHLVKKTIEERSRWYRVSESIPLSQRHAGHIISRLQDSEDSRHARKPGAA